MGESYMDQIDSRFDQPSMDDAMMKGGVKAGYGKGGNNLESIAEHDNYGTGQSNQPLMD